MSENDDNKIYNRLKIISQIQPSSDATDRAVQKVREALINEESKRQNTAKIISHKLFQSPIVKFAAAAVLLLIVGYFAGRISAPAQPSIEELKAALEPAIRQDLLEHFDSKWQSVFALNNAELKEEFQQQVRRDLMEFASQTLTASSTITERRLMELVRLIEAARLRERQQVTRALEQMEQERDLLKNGLLALATRTSEIQNLKEK